MASIIRIKRSSTAGNPTTLAAGELAYSGLLNNDSNGGDRLYLGLGVETAGNAASHLVIGGKYFTDLLDHTRGTLTASSALLVDSNSKLDNLKVDNLDLNGNAITSTDANGNITLDPNGTGYVEILGTNGLVIPVGTTAQRAPNIQGAVRYNTDTSSFEGYSGSTWGSLGGVKSVDGLTFISAESSPGASNDTLDFVTDGTSAMSIDIDSLDIASKITAVNINATTASSSSTTGALKVVGGISTQNNINVGGTLGVTGNTTLSGTLGVTGNTTLSGTLGVTNDLAVATNKFTVASASGNTVIAGTIGVAGDLAVATNKFNVAAASGNTLIAGTLGVTGNTTITGSTTLNGSVNIGAVSLQEYIEDAAGVSITAGEGIDVTYNDSTGAITIDGEYASDTNAGIAKFNTASFAVSNIGDVTIKAAGVSNTQLVNNSTTLGSTTLTLGGSTTALSGLTSVVVNGTSDFDNLQIDGNSILSTNVNGGITLDPNGTGHISASNALIKDVATPVDANDAANKAYVDAVAEGLHVHASSNVATTGTLASISGGSVTYDNGTSGVGATLTLSTGISTLDGVALTNGMRILVKDQAVAGHNGIYTRTSATVLTRALDFNTSAEIQSGDFTFVASGTIYGKTGWVQTIANLTIGTTAITFEQFAGAGTYIAGSGLSLTGNTFDIVLQTNGGLEIVSDELGLKSTTAGAGLTYTNGVLDVIGTTNRILVNANSIDIASTYVGQSSITTLGTITTGIWNGTTIAATSGGTGQSTYSIGDLLVGAATNTLNKLAIGTSGTVLQSNGTTLVYGDVDGGTYA